MHNKVGLLFPVAGQSPYLQMGIYWEETLSLTIVDDLLDAALVVDEVLALLPLLLAVGCQDRLRPDVRGLPASAETVAEI